MTLPLVADGYGLDRAIAALFCHAKHGETVSLQAARAQAAGERWGCLMCWFLDWAVERGHCALALVSGDVPTNRAASYRAGAWLLVLAAGLLAAPWVIGRVVEKAL